MHFKGADMYFAAFVAMILLIVWTVPWLIGEVEKLKEVAPATFSPNAIAVGTIGAGAFFAALACLVFLVTRTFVPSQREKELVDAILLKPIIDRTSP
jgi:hypothetical protein